MEQMYTHASLQNASNILCDKFEQLSLEPRIDKYRVLALVVAEKQPAAYWPDLAKGVCPTIVLNVLSAKLFSTTQGLTDCAPAL